MGRAGRLKKFRKQRIRAVWRITKIIRAVKKKDDDRDEEGAFAVQVKQTTTPQALDYCCRISPTSKPRILRTWTPIFHRESGYPKGDESALAGVLLGRKMPEALDPAALNCPKP